MRLHSFELVISGSRFYIHHTSQPIHLFQNQSGPILAITYASKNKYVESNRQGYSENNFANYIFANPLSSVRFSRIDLPLKKFSKFQKLLSREQVDLDLAFQVLLYHMTEPPANTVWITSNQWTSRVFEQITTFS